MFETLDKFMLAGLGALSMTKERAEKIFDDYVSRGKVEKEAKSGFVKDLMEMAEKSRGDLAELVSDQVGKAIGNLSLATSKDINRLEEKIDQLLQKE